MSVGITEKQKAYHLRKLRTRMTRLDVNEDDHISRRDFELMADRMVKYSDTITAEQGKLTRAILLEIADGLGFVEGVRPTVEEAAKQASEKLLSMSPEQGMEMCDKIHNHLFNVIDTNNDDYISVEEYKVYSKVIGTGISNDDVQRSFDAIDINKNGEISRDEFLAAAHDFLHGLEETEISEVFYGPLVS